jgi:antitoxin PrlF
LLEAEVTEDGAVTLRPVTTVDRSQVWFWQPEHQAGEREASEQSARGEGESFGSGEEFLASLQ